MRPLPDRIHILGASGTGTTTLASAIAAKHGHRHLDIDDFFWVPTDPPYRAIRPRDQRGWGDPLIPEFDLVIFLVVPTSSFLTGPAVVMRAAGPAAGRPVAEQLARIEVR